MLRAILCATLPVFAAATLRAQVPVSPAPAGIYVDPLHASGQNVTISLLTMGRGEQIWELFGHSAIWIHDNTTSRDTVFNWGVFNSRQPNFILHFLKGLMLYQMGGETLDQVLYEYRYFNRTVQSQQLDLTTAQKDSLLHLIQINAQPENIQYRYDYFRDNCSTRPRDLLDQITGGLLRANSMQVSDRTYRWHAMRLMQANKPLVVGVDLGLGEPSDRPATRWDEMFLPKELHDVVATLQVRDSTGAMHPLVARESVLFNAGTPAEPAAPPTLGPWLLAIGLIVAGLLAWLGVRGATGARGPRIAAAVAMGFWATVVGLFGLVLAILWMFTDHIFAHANENVLLFNPLWLVLAVLLPVYFFTGRAARPTRVLAMFLAGLAVLALAAHLVGLSRQANLPIIALDLPAALVIAWLTTRTLPRSPDASMTHGEPLGD
jgi:hypothetical protein